MTTPGEHGDDPWPSDAAPARRDDLAVVRVDDAIVAYSPARRRTSCLDPLSAAVLECLDGSVTLAELADDLAEVVGSDRAEAHDYLGRAVEGLRHLGLLADGDGDRGIPAAPGSQPRTIAGLVPAAAPG